MVVKLTKLILSTGGAQALLFAANLAIPFFYSPEIVATYGFYITIASLFSIASAMRLEYFVFFSKSTEPARHLILTCGFVVVFIAVLSLLLLFFVGKISSEAAFYTGISFFSFALLYLISQGSLLNKDYVGYARGRVALGAVFIFLLPVLSYFGLLGLILAYCGAQIASAVYLQRRQSFGLNVNFSKLKYSLTYRFADRGFNLFSTLIQFLSPAIPIMFGAYCFAKEDLGVFFWLSQMIGAMAAVVKRSLMGFLSAELMHNGIVQKEAVQLSRRVYALGILLSLILGFFAWCFSLFLPVFNSAWDQVSTFVVPLIFLYVFDALLQPLGSLLPSIGKEKYHLYIEIIRLLSVLMCLVLSVWLKLEISAFVWMYSLVMAFFYLVGGSIFCVAVGKNHA